MWLIPDRLMAGIDSMIAKLYSVDIRASLITCAAASAGLMLGGCSIYPTARDVTGLSTYDIVRHVRCEARAAVSSKFAGLFTLSENLDRPSYGRLTGAQVLGKLSSRELVFWEMDWGRMSPRIKSVLDYYGDASVSYDFNLDATEMNTQGAALDIAKSLYGQTAKLPFKLQDDKTRQVTRNFRVFDTFESLIKSDRMAQYCKEVGGYANFRYPLAGDKDIADLVTSFLDMNQSGNLYGSKEVVEAPTMADTIQFTTKTQANADPFLVFNRIGRTFLPTTMTINLDNYRQDFHKVIIAISLPAEKGGFTSARLVAAGERPFGRISNRVLAASELDRQQSIATTNAVQQIGQALQSGTRILP